MRSAAPDANGVSDDGIVSVGFEILKLAWSNTQPVFEIVREVSTIEVEHVSSAAKANAAARTTAVVAISLFMPQVYHLWRLEVKQEKWFLFPIFSPESQVLSPRGAQSGKTRLERQGISPSRRLSAKRLP